MPEVAITLRPDVVDLIVDLAVERLSRRRCEARELATIGFGAYARAWIAT